MSDEVTGVTAVLRGFAGPAISAFAGLVMRHVHQFEAGRPFSWRKLLVDIPTVGGLAIVGGGIGAYLGVQEETRWAIAALLGYGGQQALELIFWGGKAAVTKITGATGTPS
jgi:hypothetical protein